MKNQKPEQDQHINWSRNWNSNRNRCRNGGRPVEREWPAPISNTPENIARALLVGPPKAKEDWEYLKRHRNRSRD